MAVFKKSEPVREPEPAYTPPTPSPAPTPRRETPVGSSLIGRSMFIKGDLESEENLVIEGKMEGTLKAKNQVIVGKDGLVKADVEGHEVIIRGKIVGNVKGYNKVTIEPEGELIGNIIAQRVVLAEGSIFKGSIDMSVKEEEEAPQEEEQTEETEETQE
jgi:cytoskeletal protein CcmA (bactofilin family)